MDLGSLLSKKDKHKSRESYWSVVIEPNTVQATIWRIVDNKAQIVSRSLPMVWGMTEELVASTDAVLTSAMQELGDDDPDPEKTVFGVVSSWVKDGQIDEVHLNEIRQLCTELSLKPAGFVVLSEAISNLVKSEEGSPLTGVVLGISKETLEISIFNLGNVLGSTEVARSISVVEDVAEGLTRFADNGNIPSRFILYNSKEGELEEIRQELIKANWDDYEKIKFLHSPNIEIISPERKLDAVSLAGAVDIANVNSLFDADKKTDLDTPDSDTDASPDDDNVLSVKPEELGFALGTDITNALDSSEINSSESDVKEVVSEINNTDNSRLVQVPFVNQVKKPSSARKFFEKVRNPFSRLKPNARGSGSSTATKALGIGGIVLVLFLIGAFALWWHYPKAEVVLYLTTNKLDQRVTVIVDEGASNPDFGQAILPGRVLTTTVKGTKTTSTTGTKTVGERATGEITLYRVGTSVELERNTTIDGPGDLSFALDEAVTIASGSAGTPGKSSVNVTAVSIGSDYNLAGGATFEINGYSLSDIEAKSENSFSGGTSREASAVSEGDRERARNDLEDELKVKAISEFEETLKSSDCSNCILIDESFTVEDLEASYNNKVGDEADSVTLNLEQSVKILAVNKDDLVAFSKNLLEDRIPDGYVLRNDQIDVEFEYNSEKDGKYSLTASISANLLTQVNTDEIAKRIAGKYPQIAEDYLVANLSGFVRAEINLKPRLRGRLGTLPRVPKNITIEIGADR